DQLDRITVEQVRSAMNVWLDAADLPPSSRHKRFEEELEKQQYYQRRNQQARKSHYRYRWTGTETFHRDGKQELGMGDCQLRDGQGQTRQRTSAVYRRVTGTSER
ncbi:MAG: hypothetical protein ACC645_20515, partial [Pirellulales bacterium]